MNNLVSSTSYISDDRQKGKQLKIMTFTISLRWAFVLMTTAVLSTPLSAWADKVVANADFVNTSVDGCIDIETNIFVKSGQLGKKRGLEKSRATLNISQIDTCQGNVLMSAEAKNINLKNREFTIDNGKATLNANIQMVNHQTGNKLMVDVLVQWITDSDPVTAKVTTDIEAPGQFVALLNKARKTLYLANAYGSITDGNTDFIKGSAEEASFTITKSRQNKVPLRALQ